MKTGSGSRDPSPLRHQRQVRADVVDRAGTTTADEIVERGRTRNMVSKFEEVGSKVNVCGSGSRPLASSHVENMRKMFDGGSGATAKQTDVILGRPAIKALVGRFEPPAGSSGSDQVCGRPDGPTRVAAQPHQGASERLPRSRSLASRGAASAGTTCNAATTSDLLPSKPKWMTALIDKNRLTQLTGRQIAEPRAAATGWGATSNATVTAARRTSSIRRMWSEMAGLAMSSSSPTAARRTPSINRRSASAHRTASLHLDD